MSKKEMLEIPVVKLEQRGLVLYQGKIKARELLDAWDVKRFEEDYLRGPSAPPGYQREVEKRAEEIATYVRECQIPLIPSLLLSVKGAEFKEFERGFGILRVPKGQKSIYVIDGQHRGYGFHHILRSIADRLRYFPTTAEEKRRKLFENEIKELEFLLDFELPATFIDGDVAAKVATERVDKSIVERELGKTALSSDDVERVFFFVINKTQKAIKPALKDVLMYLIASAGINGIPIIEREWWRKEAVPLVRDLHYDRDSPLCGLISLIGRRGAAEPVKLNTFVKSLQPLIEKNDEFQKLGREKQLKYLKTYWTVIKEMYGDAFRKERIKDYLVLRSLSVYALNRLANDVFNWCRKDGIELPSEDDVRRYIGPLKSFDWRSDSSPVMGLGGEKGVREAYRRLLQELSNAGIEKAARQLEILESRRRR
jgi:hypothetical protein